MENLQKPVFVNYQHFGYLIYFLFICIHISMKFVYTKSMKLHTYVFLKHLRIIQFYPPFIYNYFSVHFLKPVNNVRTLVSKVVFIP